MTVPTTVTVPTTEFDDSEPVPVRTADPVTETEHVTQTEFATQQVNNTVVETYFAAPSLNPQTGDRPGVLLSASEVSARRIH